MPVIIPDETLKQAGLTEQEMKVEIACRLFGAGKLHLWPAAQLSGLSRDEFWTELLQREIPVFRVTEQDLEQDLRTLERIAGPEGDK